MSSMLFKAVFAGAVTAGALLLPVTAAEASAKHHPCDEPGFSGAFFGHRDGLFGDRFGDDFDHFGRFDDDFDAYGDYDDVDFDRPQVNQTTVVIVKVPAKGHHKPAKSNHKPAKNNHKPSGNGNANANGNDGYGNGNGGYGNGNGNGNGNGYRKSA